MGGAVRRRHLVLWAVVAALTVGACGKVPQPFQPLSKPLPAIAPGPRTALVVEPVAGGANLAGLVATALQKLEVAATARAPESPRYRLAGRIESRPGANGRTDLDLTWWLVAPDGRAGQPITQSETVPAAAWADADPALLHHVAVAAAAKVDRLLLPGGPAIAATRRIVVAPVDGAPGDGREALAKAMRASLKRRDIAVAEATEDVGEDGYMVLGDVMVTDHSRAEQRITISWAVIRPDGREMGRISQSNTIPRGRLDNRWGEIALLAAEGGADGVVELLERLKTAGVSDAE